MNIRKIKAVYEEKILHGLVSMGQLRMLMLGNQIYCKRHALLTLCLLLGLSESILAGGRSDITRDSQPTEEIVPQSADADDNSAQTLDGNITDEERLRLRRDLDEYSRSVDPAHVQIEERRRVMHQRLVERFASSDKDNDGSISREEAAETMPQIARHFNQVDLNGDGIITLNELEAAQARAIERHRAETAKNEVQDPEPPKRKNKDASPTHKRAL